MAYIGRDTDKLSNVEVLDNITFDGSSSYTLQKNSVNFIPSSANTLLVSIDGVVQAGNFTVSGSTIDFGTAVAGTSTCDFILHYGTGLITTPADGTVTSAKIGANAVTNAKLNNDIISGATELATEPADTDEFLVSDAGTLKRIDYSLIKGGGITEADQWRLSAGVAGISGTLTSNLERVDGSGQGIIGTGMTESSGIFTFPSTGVYLVSYSCFFTSSSGSDVVKINTEVSIDGGSTFTTVVRKFGTANLDTTVNGSTLIDVTNTSNFQVKFTFSSISATTTLNGNTDSNNTDFTFIRLGDT